MDTWIYFGESKDATLTPSKGVQILGLIFITVPRTSGEVRRLHADSDVLGVSNLPPLEADGCGDATIYLLTLELSAAFSDLSPLDNVVGL